MKELWWENRRNEKKRKEEQLGGFKETRIY
jgi:hypothetical protein